jgi:hypothetical protein
MPRAMTVRKATAGQNSRRGGSAMSVQTVTVKHNVNRIPRDIRFHLAGRFSVASSLVMAQGRSELIWSQGPLADLRNDGQMRGHGHRDKKRRVLVRVVVVFVAGVAGSLLISKLIPRFEWAMLLPMGLAVGMMIPDLVTLMRGMSEHGSGGPKPSGCSQ